MQLRKRCFGQSSWDFWFSVTNAHTHTCMMTRSLNVFGYILRVLQWSDLSIYKKAPDHVVSISPFLNFLFPLPLALMLSLYILYPCCVIGPPPMRGSLFFFDFILVVVEEISKAIDFLSSTLSESINTNIDKLCLSVLT